MPQQTPAEIERVIREALKTGNALSIVYLNTHLIVTPLSVGGGLLTTWADSMNRAKQFRVEFIREALIVPAERVARAYHYDDGEAGDDV